MLKRWIPQDRILKRALSALLMFALCLGIAGGLGAWDHHLNGRPEREQKAVLQAVRQFGPNSQEVANAVKLLGEKSTATEAIAVLDPATGKAVAAWPADLVGKKPDEMALASGIKMPTWEMLQSRGRFNLEHGTAKDEKELSVSLTRIYPWSGEGGDHEGEHGDWRGEGRPFQGFGRKDGEHGGRGGDHGVEGGQAVQPPLPQAVLLTAAFKPGATPLRIAAAVFGGLGTIAFTIYWLSLAWWVFADARRRGGRAFGWGVLVLLTNLVGAAVYLVARQQQQTCEACGTTAERSFNHCPSCGKAFNRVCGNCGHTLRSGWTHCVNCGARHEPPHDAV